MKPTTLFLFIALWLTGIPIQAQPIATAPTFKGLPIWAFRGFHDSLPVQNTMATYTPTPKMPTKDSVARCFGKMELSFHGFTKAKKLRVKS